ncbi:MAG: glycosyltransferase family 4 protein [Bacteroidetes bacterium]|nr:glycosyltransferase family 4 protein [Bacteroidota bacterium]
MKKIALITDGIWPYVLGGMQKHSYYLCKYFAQNKIEVDLYHFNQSEFDINELKVFTEEERKYIHSFILKFPNEKKGFGHYLKNSRSYSELVYEVIKPHLATYDFIYTKGFSGWKLIEEKRKGNIECCKIGVKFHGYEMFQKAPDFKIYLQQLLLLRKPVRQITLMADVVFSYGGKITDIVKQLGVSSERIIEMPSGVEENTLVEFIKPTGKIIEFVFLGRYERRKGVEELNEALKSLDKNSSFKFHFIGPIPNDKKIIDHRIVYHGEIREKETLNNLLRTCDVLICPSHSEGMPNVILEAMSNGLCVIATDVGATNILVNHQTGWLLKAGASVAIKNCMKEVLEVKTEIVDEKKKNALSLIKSALTWEHLIPQLLEKIRKVN